MGLPYVCDCLPPLRTQLVYDIDAVEEWRELSHEKYTSKPSSSKWSWTLLAPISLNGVSPGEMISNPAGSARGAPRKNRFTPLYGPTSANTYVPRTSVQTEAAGGGKRRKR